jgi:hypothetical protein
VCGNRTSACRSSPTRPLSTENQGLFDMKGLAIALQYNRWLRLGCISIPASCIGLGLAVWYFIVNIDDFRTAALATYVVEASIGYVAFSAMVVYFTKNGRGTLRTYRRSVRRIETNKARIAIGMRPLRYPWQVDQWATTYCQRAGVVAAACEMNLPHELPPRYQRWWCIIATRPRKPLGGSPLENTKIQVKGAAMSATEIQIACKNVQPGDAIQVSQLKAVADGRLGTVLAVRPFGAMVAIDTDLGITGAMPVNQRIKVWRP